MKKIVMLACLILLLSGCGPSVAPYTVGGAQPAAAYAPAPTFAPSDLAALDVQSRQAVLAAQQQQAAVQAVIAQATSDAAATEAAYAFAQRATVDALAIQQTQVAMAGTAQAAAVEQAQVVAAATAGAMATEDARALAFRLAVASATREAERAQWEREDRQRAVWAGNIYGYVLPIVIMAGVSILVLGVCVSGLRWFAVAVERSRVMRTPTGEIIYLAPGIGAAAGPRVLEAPTSDWRPPEGCEPGPDAFHSDIAPAPGGEAMLVQGWGQTPHMVTKRPSAERVAAFRAAHHLLRVVIAYAGRGSTVIPDHRKMLRDGKPVLDSEAWMAGRRALDRYLSAKPGKGTWLRNDCGYLTVGELMHGLEGGFLDLVDQPPSPDADPSRVRACA